MLSMIELFNCPTPTNDEMRSAPLLYRWHLQETRSAVEVHGIVSDHPHLPDGDWIRTTELVQIDPSDKPRWLRTESRLYCLGKPMRATENRIRREAAVAGLTVSPDVVSGTELRQFKEVFGLRRARLDEAERLLLILIRHNRVDAKRAIQQHKLLLMEICR